MSEEERAEHSRWNELIAKMPRQIRKMKDHDPLANKVIILCFKNKMSYEEILVNLVIFKDNQAQDFRDALIEKESRRVVPQLYIKGQ